MIRRRTALVIAFLSWLGIEVASWALNTWLSSNVNAENIGVIQTHLKSALDYLSSGFTLGFVIGAALFSAWDWPLLGAWLRKQRERMRNKEADETGQSFKKMCMNLSINLKSEPSPGRLTKRCIGRLFRWHCIAASELARSLTGYHIFSLTKLTCMLTY